MNLAPLAIQKFFDNNGNPINGGLLFTYVSGTTTKIATYTDSSGGTPNTNPIVLDYRGEARVWLDPTLTYKFTLAPPGDTDPPSKPIWTVDNITSAISFVDLTQQIIGQILYPRTAAEIAAGVTPTFYYYPPGDVRRYGADSAGVTNSAPAFTTALLANQFVYIPPGTYRISSTVSITGDRMLTGPWAGTLASQSVFLVHDAASGAMIEDIGGGFGGCYIGNFRVGGGSGDGSYCINSTRPQTIIERVQIEPSSGAGYNNNGIKIGDGGVSGDGSWDTSIKECKWVGPASHTNYRGYLVDVDGGNVDLYHCNAIRGSIGIEVLRCESLRIQKCDLNLQSSDFSSEPSNLGQCCIRLSGTGLKKGVKIDSCYLEGSSTSVWIDTVEACSINDTFIDDAGNGGLPAIILTGSDSKNVTINSCDILSRSIGGKCIQNAGANTTISGCKLVSNANSTNIPLDNTGTGLITINNRVTGDVGGLSIKTTTPMVDQGNTVVSGARSEAASDMQYLFPTFGSWTPTLSASTTPGTHTYSIRQGTYFQIGRRIFADFVITLSAKDAAMAGNVRISGLPVTSRNLAVSSNAVTIASYDNIDLSAGKSQLTAVVNSNSTVAGLIECGDNVASAAITAAAISNTSGIRGTAIYDF